MEQVTLEQKGNGDPAVAGKTPPRLPLPPADDVGRRLSPKAEWSEERLLDDAGEEIFISYKGEPSVARYEFIRDFLNFKLSRIKRPGERREQFLIGNQTYEVRATPIADRWLVRIYQDEMPIGAGTGVPYSILAQRPDEDLVSGTMEGERRNFEQRVRMAAARPAELNSLAVSPTITQDAEHNPSPPRFQRGN